MSLTGRHLRDALIAAARRIPLVELTLARFREFLREPEAVFWVFAFPVIMTCALGIAFRSRGAEPVIVGVVEQAGDEPIAQRARAARRLHGAALAAGRRRSRAARRPGAGGGGAGHAADVSLRRGARREPGGAAGRRRGAAARRRPRRRVHAARAADRCRRLALHRLARARPARHEHHEHRPVGRRLLDRPGAHAQAAEAAGGDADVARRIPGLARAQPPASSSRSRRR